MATQDEESTLAFLADTQHNGSYFEVFVLAWEYANGEEADAHDRSVIDIHLAEYLHGADLPLFVKQYVRNRGAGVLPA